MKQFIICFLLTLFIYVSGSFLGKSFNPMDWSNSGGTLFFCFFVFMVWVVPIYLNYVNGEENFSK